MSYVDLDLARTAEGCPRGSDEALLALSGPPLYTPYPNPYVDRFLSTTRRRQVAGSASYSREPIAIDITERRTDPAYMAQNYHTKLPYRAIMRYLEHFTEPGDLVMDGFCGSGMVGVAANQTGRRAILCDLSPAATFMAHSYCHPVDPAEFGAAYRQLLADLERECGWMYEFDRLPTDLHHSSPNYVIWSEVFCCPHCSAQFPFSQVAFDFKRRRPVRQFTCPSCGSRLRSRRLPRCLDDAGRTREVPVMLGYVARRRRREREPSEAFLRLQEEIARLPIPYWYPDNPMMNRPSAEGGWGDMWRSGYHTGIERVSDFYFKRSLWVLAAAVHLTAHSGASTPVRQLMLQVVVNASTLLTRMRRAYQGVLPLVMYVPKMRREVSAPTALACRFRVQERCLEMLRFSEDVLITTQSTTCLSNVPDGCVDYIFTDPPYGDNIRYSEVNFLWESWLRVFTDQEPEAVISHGQSKGVEEYRELMRRCFAEMHRVLKPGRWLTLAFHNSDSEVWNAIQDTLQQSGFQVADVGMLDKKQISFKQASAGTPRHDLVISARKAGTAISYQPSAISYQPSSPNPQPLSPNPDSSPITHHPSLITHHSSDPIWEFAREHLSRLPVPSPGDGRSPAAAGRKGLELFNRMVADCLQRGAPVPVSAQQFEAELRAHFVERKGMFFLPEQAAEYDRLVTSSDGKI